MKNIIKNAVKPKTANPATPNPITVPPAKEIFNAFGNDVLEDLKDYLESTVVSYNIVSGFNKSSKGDVK